MKILNLILIFTSLFCFAQKIEWTNQYKLKSQDFNGKISTIDSEKVAGSMVNMEYRILSTSIWTGKIKVKIFPTFDTTISWINPQFISENILNHEQRHFDIAQFFALKLQKVVDRSVKSTKDFNEIFEKIYNENYREYEEFQTKYDLYTAHGTILKIQEKYDTIISEMLKNCNSRE